MKSRSRTLPELPRLNGNGKPLLTLDQIAKKWGGVFEPEFWEEVRRARKPVIKPLSAKE